MGREVWHYENFQPRQKILIFNILLMLVCFTSMALWIQGSNVVNTNWKTRIKSPRQLETEVGKIIHQKSEEHSDMKKLPRVILIGARHCGAGQRLLLLKNKAYSGNSATIGDALTSNRVHFT